MIAIAGLVLGYCTGLVDPYSLPKYLVVACCAAYYLWRKPLYVSDFDPLLEFHILVVTLACYFSKDRMVSLLGQYGSYYTALLPTLALAGLFKAGHGEDRRKLYKVFIVCSVLAAVMGISQKFGYLLPYGTNTGDRIYGSQGGPVYFSLFNAMAIPIALELGWFWSLPFFAICIVLTLSRAGFLAAMVGVGIWALGRVKIDRKWALAGLSASVLGVVAIKHYRPPTCSDTGHVVMAQVAWNVWYDHPILGTGPETFFRNMSYEYRTPEINAKVGDKWSNGYVHNAFLEVLSSTGLLGMVPFCLMLIGCAVLMWDSQDYGLMGMACGIFVFSMFEPTPLAAKGILALFFGSACSKIEHAYPSSFAYAVRCLLTVIAGIVIAMTVGTRMQILSARYGNETMLRSSIHLHPVIYR